MKKFSKILESVWGDLHSRGIGKLEREEDDVNLLDKEGLYEYIKKKYESKVVWMQSAATTIVIEPIEKIYLSLNYRYDVSPFIIWSGRIDMPYVSMSFLKKIEERFKLRHHGYFEKIVTEKDGTINNQTFIDFVDMFIENIDNILNENLWADLHKRGVGEIEREEDDVNHLNQDDFYNYLTANYKITKPSFSTIVNSKITKVITVPVIIYPFVETVYFNFRYKKIRVHYDLPYTIPNLFNKLTDNFIIKQDGDEPIYLIFPKDKSEVTNQFFLDFIDFVLENTPVNERGIEKIDNVNESVWGDLHKRGIGELEREEDKFDNLDEEGLLTYLQKHYKIDNCTLDIKLVHDNSDIQIPFCTAGYKNIKINALYYNCSSHTVFLRNDFYKYLPELHNKLKKEFQMTDNPIWPFYISISPKDNTEITNTFFIKFLEFVIDNMDNTVTPTITKRQVNESVWGDLHKRGIGELEREEDDVNLLDLEGLCDYLNKIYKSPSSVSKSICVQHFNPDFDLSVSLYEDIDGYYRFLFYNGSVINTQKDVLYELKCNKEIQQKYSLKQLKNDFGVETVDIYPKDGSPVNNEFFLEVLEFFLENIKEPYTKLIEKIEDVKESVWGDLHKRGIGELEREEDKIGNIKDMIPVDMGGLSVLWSDRDLEVDDNCYFSFDEANELIEKSGWRLPTREEAEELCVSVRIERNTDKICIVYREDKPDVQLTFKKCGQKYGDNDDKIYRKDTYNTWTSTAQGTEAYRIFKISSLIFGTNFQMHKNNKICVRLVKDKPNDIKESVWGDLHKRGIGELEREEDDIDHLDIDTFLGYLQDRYQRINYFSPRISKNEKLQSISVPIYFVPTNFFTTYLVLGFKDNKDITFNVETSKFPFVVDRLFDNLKEQFNVTIGNKRKELASDVYYTEDWTISPKDGKKVTNQFMVEVIDFLLDNIDEKPFIKQLVKNVNESVWGDLHKRGIGELEREEDDINFMDVKSFKEYIEHFDDAITKVYLGINKDFISVDDVCIETEKKNKYYQLLLVIEYPEKKIFMNDQFKKDAPDVFSKLTKEFSVSVKRGFIDINPKDGSEKTNRFFLDVLRFILDNLKNELNESVWGDLHKRGVGELEREEDNIGNLSELKPLDMGLSVLWADKDLEVDGDYLFNFEEANELIEKSEWRLPTLKEVSELNLLYNTGKYFYDDKSFYFENNGNKLIFYRKGFQYISAYGRKPKNIDEDYYYCWTSDIYDSDCIHILSFDDKKIYHSPVNNRRVTDQIIQRKNDELCVRLVKNKKRED